MLETENDSIIYMYIAYTYTCTCKCTYSCNIQKYYCYACISKRKYSLEHETINNVHTHKHASNTEVQLWIIESYVHEVSQRNPKIAKPCHLEVI